VTVDDDVTWWSAPVCPEPVDAVVEVPGSKSITNRALILAALSDGPSRIGRALRSRDTDLMAEALRTLGVGITTHEIDDATVDLEVVPHYLRTERPTTIDVGLAGTVMRFLPPVAALAHGDLAFDGDRAARRRPMATLIEALRDVGVDVEDAGRGLLPILVHGTGRVPGGEVMLDASRSSQFVSALLLSGARFEAGITIRHVGGPVPSTPHIDMTIAMLADHGVRVRSVEESEISGHSRRTWHVDPCDLAAIDRVIEPDISNALPFIAAALATGGRILIRHWPRESIQPTEQVLDVIRAFGGQISTADNSLEVIGPAELSGVQADLRDIGETAPTFAALAALAGEPSSLHGIAHLRGHETDRLAALHAEISALGGQIEQTDDALLFRPASLSGNDFRTYEDHRMATCAAILGLRVPGIRVENIETTAKTLPGFPQRWNALLPA
jgi:3-phosphoshikimate 1-carboxyvinyltransferase